MWKLVSVLFMTAIRMELCITSVYWAILWPIEKKVDDQSYLFYKTSVVHMLPLIYLTTDFILNRITIEWSLLWLQWLIDVLYTFCNIHSVRKTGNVVYPGLDWACKWSVVAVFCCYLISAGFFWALCSVSEWKLKKF